MSICYKCKKRGNFQRHHIDGMGTQFPTEIQNNNENNLIILCPDCHDLVEGICAKCSKRSNCFDIMFKECWRFEDALPPIHFREDTESIIENLDNVFYQNRLCPKCNSNKIKRISKWFYDGVYKHTKNWIAIYKCIKCGYNFKRVFESLIERSIDNKNTTIEIDDWNLSAGSK